MKIIPGIMWGVALAVLFSLAASSQQTHPILAIGSSSAGFRTTRG